MNMMIGWLTGLVTGGLFFGGLWWTVRSAATDELAPLRFLLSFVVRMGLVATGAYLIVDLGWQSLAAFTVGILASRLALVTWLSYQDGALLPSSVGSASGSLPANRTGPEEPHGE